MKKASRLIYTLIFITSIATFSWTQDRDDRGYYLVESEKFSPPIKDMIASFEGRVAEGFLAPDIYGTEHYLYDYRGKPVVLFFFNLEDENGRRLIERLKSIQEQHKEDISIIGMAKNSKEELIEYFGIQKTSFPLIYNGEVFGQMAYGADLGSPRIFIIDSSGKIKRVLPSSIFHSEKAIDDLILECINSVKN